MQRILFPILSFIFLLILPAHAAQIQVSSEFSPPSILPNQTSIYKLTVNGSFKIKAPDLPQVKGLQISYIGPQNISFTYNGQSNSSVTHSYLVKATSQGTYTIPSFKITINNQSYDVPEASLSVSTSPSQPSPKTLPIELSLDLPSASYYVGQIIPATLSFFTPTNIPTSVSLPQKLGDAFSELSISSDPERGQSIRNNTDTNYVIWQLFLSPLKPGSHPLSYAVRATVNIPSASSIDSFHSFFNSAFDSFFNNLTAEPEIHDLTSQLKTINILPLPTQNQPSSFSGGVGQFSLDPSASLSHSSCEVGSPITLKFAIKGFGNFQSFSPPNLKLDPKLWKTYPPKTSFTSSDGSPFLGTKTFEYILIPLSTSITALPQIPISYFDPQQNDYISLTIPALTLTVNPASQDHTSTPTSPPAITPQSTPTVSSQATPQPAPPVTLETPNTALPPIKLQISSTTLSLLPLTHKAYFWYLQVLPLAFLLSTFLHLRKKRLQLQNAHYKKNLLITQTLQSALSSCRQLYAKRDIHAFYHNLQENINLLIAHNQLSPTKSLTFDEIILFLENHQSPPSLITFVRELATNAELAKFSGTPVQDTLNPEFLKNSETFLNQLSQWLLK